jgi:archaellum component FlaC
MQTMRESWTDERLDGFREEVREDFRRVDARFEQIDRRFEQVDSRFDQVDERLGQIDKRLNRIEDGFFALQRTLTATGGAMIVGLFGLLFTQL